MIKDKNSLCDIRESWCTARILEARIATTLSPVIFSLLPVATGFREVPDSMLLLLAISVLKDALKQLRDEGVFVCKGSELKRLMDASRNVLPWQDFGKIAEVRNRRNAIAHRRAFLSVGECAPYLTEIETELLAWGILEHRIKGEFRISMGGTPLSMKPEAP